MPTLNGSADRLVDLIKQLEETIMFSTETLNRLCPPLQNDGTPSQGIHAPAPIASAVVYRFDTLINQITARLSHLQLNLRSINNAI